MYFLIADNKDRTRFQSSVIADEQGVLAAVSARRTSSDASRPAAGPAGTVLTAADTVLPEPTEEPPLVFTPQLPNPYTPVWEQLAGCGRDEEPFVRYVDGRFDGLECLAAAPDPSAARLGPPPVDPREIALDVVEHLPLPDIQIRVNPGLGLVGLPGWFWVEGYDGRPFGAAPTVT
ncbi:MAG: hypothetical protein GEU73_17335, partial [Chloroflexi bacterium]|nr:hypothetical protein [Chloroflexota bacterium]